MKLLFKNAPKHTFIESFEKPRTHFNMVNIRDILSTLYADRSAEDLYAWLNEQELLEPFKRVAIQLNSIITDEESLIENCRVIPVGHIAANLLCTINRRLAGEGKLEKAKEMANILGDICLGVLLSFLNSIKSDKSIVWLQINYALKDTCDFHNYDFNQLLQFLKIEASYLQSRKSADAIVRQQSVPSLCWKGRTTQLSDFLEIFIDQKMLKSKKGLTKLFENPEQALQLQFHPGMADLVVQFFYTIKNRKLVTHTGCKGFYQVFEFHIPDFKKDFLKKREAGRRINVLRQSEAKWHDNQQRIDKWLQNFQVSKTGSQTVLQT